MDTVAFLPNGLDTIESYFFCFREEWIDSSSRLLLTSLTRLDEMVGEHSLVRTRPFQCDCDSVTHAVPYQ
jgi:hypothetical protein